MTTGEQPTPSQAIIEGQLRTALLEPLCGFFAFPDEHRLQVLRSLEAASTVIPTAGEIYKARHLGGKLQWDVEKRYGEAADTFARSINPEFNPQATPDSNGLEITRLRGDFYLMIRTLSSELVQDGVRILRQIEPALPKLTT